MSGTTFDANIVIDALGDHEQALTEIETAARTGAWISRMVWIEVMSKGSPEVIAAARVFLGGFEIDEIDGAIADRAADLRRQRPRLKAPDAIILATAQLRGRTLVTRNIKDFAAGMPGIRVPYTL